MQSVGVGEGMPNTWQMGWHANADFRYFFAEKRFILADAEDTWSD